MIRIFVSSTFQDFKEERDALAEQVFPELEKKCRKNGFSFQAIDLRWGISQQNSLDNKTLQICIDEIARCRKLSPRPNFLIISGRRYGWIPLPCSITPTEWNMLMDQLPENSEDRQFLNRWYRQDLNDLKKEYLLQPRTGEYEDDTKWYEEEEGLKKTLFALAKQVLPEGSLVRYGLSATEQEIYHGLFWADDNCDHKLVVLKEGEPKELPAKKLTEQDLAETERLQNHLKEFSYHGEKPNIVSYDDGESFPIDKIKEHFDRIIDEEIENARQAKPYEQECAVVSSEIKYVKDNYINAAKNEQEFQTFVEKHCGKAVLVTGESGSGKSMMLKYWYGKNEARSAAAFADVQPGCRSVLYAIWFASMELKRKGYLDEVEAMPEMEKCVEWFERQLSRVSATETVTVILDSINHMDDWNQIQSSFFTMKFPPNVTLIISCFSKESLSKQEQMMDIPAYSMKLLEKQSGIHMLELKLRSLGRCLNFDKTMMECRMPDKTTPLYIHLLSDVCRRIHSYDSPELFPDAKNARELIRFLVRKQSAGTYSVMYHHILGYLALADEGLSEQELLEILASDREVCEEIRSQTEWDFKGKIPSALWVRILVEIQDFLMEAERSGILLYRFRHMLIHREIKSMIGEARLKVLAFNMKEYFRKQELTWKGKDDALVLNLRKIREYYPLLVYLNEWKELGLLLENPIYSDCLVRVGRYRELLGQFRTLEQHAASGARHAEILKVLRKKPILFQTWTDSLRQVLYSEGVIGNPELVTEAGKRYVLTGKERHEEDADNIETMFVAESSTRTMALREDGLIAILVNGNVQIIDWKLRTSLRAACRIGTDYMELYWIGEELVARGEYCRAVLRFNGSELYILKQESCPGFVELMRKEGMEKAINRAGGPRETDAIFSESSQSFLYFRGRNLRRTELYYPYKTAFKLYLLGYLAAVVVDYRHVEIVDLNRRVVLNSWDLPSVSRIYWSGSGRKILVSLFDNRIAVLPVNTEAKGIPLAVPDRSGSFDAEKERNRLLVEDFQNVMDHIVRPTWNGDKPIRSNADEHLPVLAAFSVRNNWIAYYYNRHNHAIVRLFRLDTQELIATEYVDPVFCKDTIRPAFYSAEEGKKLVLMSAGKIHIWDIDSLRWQHGSGRDGKAFRDLKLSDEVNRVLREEYPEAMKKWYPLKAAEKQFAYKKSVADHMIDAVIGVLLKFVKLMFWYVKLSKPADYTVILREQLTELPVYRAGELFVVPNAAIGMLHLCDEHGNWICHEQLEKPFWAIDIVEDKIYILIQDSNVPIIKEIRTIGGEKYD